jgi:hypothetical protein
MTPSHQKMDPRTRDELSVQGPEATETGILPLIEQWIHGLGILDASLVVDFPIIRNMQQSDPANVAGFHNILIGFYPQTQNRLTLAGYTIGDSDLACTTIDKFHSN